MYIHLASEQFSKISALQLPCTVSPWMNPGEEGERGKIRDEEEEKKMKKKMMMRSRKRRRFTWWLEHMVMNFSQNWLYWFWLKCIKFYPIKCNFACPSANHTECINSSLCGRIQRFIRNFCGTNNGSSVNNEAACYKLNKPSTLQVWQASLDYGCLISIFTVISRQVLGSIWPPTMYVKEDPSAYVKCVEAEKSSTKK